MNSAPRIAVIAVNTLAGIGLRSILEKIIPIAEVCVFRSFDEFAGAGDDDFVHYFIDSQTFIEHAAEFAGRRTILLTASPSFTAAGCMPSLCIANDEEHIVRDILRLHRMAHGACPTHHAQPAETTDLSPREREVLVMIAKGLMNKEIADRLGIGLTTVISHRRNLSSKLGIKSVSGLTIYAVMRGYVDADDI
ncbi:MAG: helix-turn-helix transcriptional regulator [Alistipes sp.]|nr:helix-turn-helix transcriptional regulator [Alistipes sp.]